MKSPRISAESYLYSQSVLKSVITARRCRSRGDCLLAGGLQADNKFNFDQIPPDTLGARLFAKALSSRLKPFRPDLLVSTPTGPDGHMPVLSSIMGIPHILLDRVSKGDPPELSVPNNEIVDASRRIAMVEDVRTTGFSCIQAARVIGLEKVVVAGDFVDRGQDVEGLVTLEDVVEYSEAHPSEPMPHMQSSFPWVTALGLPIPRMIGAN